MNNVGKLQVHKNCVNILHYNEFSLKTDSKSKKLADQDLQCVFCGKVVWDLHCTMEETQYVIIVFYAFFLTVRKVERRDDCK